MLQPPPESALLAVYNRSDVTMVRGDGAYLYDDKGTRYLDCAAGIAVNGFGHCHPHLVQALQQQAATLWHCSNLFRTEGQERLARRMAEGSFADTIFFTNSGNEAVECGLKMMRRYHYAKGKPRPRIITVQGGFHGRSLACISAGQNSRATEGFGPLLDGFDQAAFHDMDSMRAAVTPQTGGILLEVIQGEGGIRVHSDAYLRAVRALADEHGLLLMLDEVQCGMGRTGRLFAFEEAGIAPDICSIAKGIGGGFPLGACLATAEAASGMTRGSHGGTYGGNPLAMAAGNAVWDLLTEEGFLPGVAETGRYFKAALEALSARFPALLGELRGQGLMLGLKLKVDPQAFAAALRGQGMLAVAASADSVLRIVPPLTLTRAQCDEAVACLTRTCESWA